MQSGPGSRSLEVFISRCSSEQPEVFHSGVMGFVKLLTEEDMTSLYEGGFGLYVLQAVGSFRWVVIFPLARVYQKRFYIKQFQFNV